MFVELRKAIRRELLTTEQFAEKIGISRQALSAKLNGKAAWSLKDVYLTINALGKTLDDVPVLFPCMEVMK